MTTPRIALIGGDDDLERELALAAEGAQAVVLVPGSAASVADLVIVAGGPLGSALDLARVERSQTPARAVLLVDSSVDALDAMACGARGMIARPITSASLTRALELAGAFRPVAQHPDAGAVRPLVLIGAAGGVGTTSCVIALAAAVPTRIVLDLVLATGDAAEVAAARVALPDALLALTSAPALAQSELDGHLATAESCRVLPAPRLPEHADLIDVEGVERVLAACARSVLQPVVDAGVRIGVETIPALERAERILIVAGADARGMHGARRVALLLGRLGLAERPVQLVVQRARGLASARDAAAGVGIPLAACVRSDRRVARARERGLPLPLGAFRDLVEAVGR